MDEKERKQILFDLQTAMSISIGSSHDYLQTMTKHGGVLWIHFTDYYGVYDLKRLLDLEILEYHPYLTYAPDNSWRDHFPPTAYRMTAKGRNIVTHQARWVFDGLFDEPEPRKR